MEFTTYHGNSLTIMVEYSTRDTYPNNFRLHVRIIENGRTYNRVGYGKFIGNFSPIWVNWKGKRTQIEILLAQ